MFRLAGQKFEIKFINEKKKHFHGRKEISAVTISKIEFIKVAFN